MVNLGHVRNDGIEFALDVRPIRTSFMDWTSQLIYSQNRNVLRKLNKDAAFLSSMERDVRYVEGYPLAGRWNRPMASFTDMNQDGVIDPSEIQYVDSARFQGGPQPRYTASLINSVMLFNGQITASATLSYTDRQTQVDELFRQSVTTSRAMNDPTTPLATQAIYSSIIGGGLTAGRYAVTQTVSTLRFNSMAVSYLLPRLVASRLRATTARINLQGDNLGVRSNYSGLDPNMNALVNELDGSRDIGSPPSPRTWRLSVDVIF
jgi:hypothetical protein